MKSCSAWPIALGSLDAGTDENWVHIYGCFMGEYMKLRLPGTLQGLKGNSAGEWYLPRPLESKKWLPKI